MLPEDKSESGAPKTATWLVVREPLPRAYVVEMDAVPSSAESPSEAAAFSRFVRDARPGESVVVRVIGLHGAGIWRFVVEVSAPAVRMHELTHDNLRLGEISAVTGLPVSWPHSPDSSSVTDLPVSLEVKP